MVVQDYVEKRAKERCGNHRCKKDEPCACRTCGLKIWYEEVLGPGLPDQRTLDRIEHVFLETGALT